ncbi:MAG: tail-specific protease, partial [Melioribacter sp.]|nr:tail-specific protease [Melioribacter sp.]
MRKYLIAILVILTINICFAQNTLEVLKKDHTIDSSKVILPDEIYKRIDQVIVQILSNYHYKKQRLNDSLSSVIFDEYIKNLDNAKSYFLKQDIEAFEKYRYQFDDFLNSGDLNIPFEIFNVYKKRLGERINY